jgi:hypothetical protein
MAGQTPDQIAAQWASRLAGSTQRIKDGVNAVSVAPGQAAARQKDVWAQNVAASKDKWAGRVASVSLSDWQQAMNEKGSARIGAGAQAAQPKFAQFMGQLLPHIASTKASLPARGNLDQNIARAAAFARGMATFSRRG